MAVKVFLTGVTGYIGGNAFDYIYNAHKENEYTVLIRDEKRAEQVKAKYPTVKFVYGTLDDTDIVEKAATEADVVVHTADSSDNVPGATAIAKGLEAGHTPENPGYWIHLSGTGILTWFDEFNNRGGEPPVPEQKYYDVDGVDRLVTLPDRAFHRNVDKLVQDSISDSVKVLILCPPTIYGVGSGPVNTRSIQVPSLVKITLRDGYAPIIGQGLTEWDNVHIDDLGDLYVKLFDATQDAEKKNNPEIFGLNAYFFAAGGVHLWSDIARQITGEVKNQGFRQDAETKNITISEVSALESGSTSWGYNSKGVAQRAKKYLGWEPKGVPLEATIADLVKSEAKALGL
ncbi:Oxidase ucsJ [Cladobotryum mycophilum]|uniref:Oxidase ucsJ n=1 Tax=Cladobotryum mycophilum TaxID=491253 RepID=A0ABR0SKP4_9HYPO